MFNIRTWSTIDNPPMRESCLNFKTENHSLIFQHFETTSEQTFSLRIVKTHCVNAVSRQAYSKNINSKLSISLRTKRKLLFVPVGCKTRKVLSFDVNDEFGFWGFRRKHRNYFEMNWMHRIISTSWMHTFIAVQCSPFVSVLHFFNDINKTICLNEPTWNFEQSIHSKFSFSQWKKLYCPNDLLRSKWNFSSSWPFISLCVYKSICENNRAKKAEKNSNQQHTRKPNKHKIIYGRRAKETSW